MSCLACQAKDAELAFLRNQVEQLQDRMLATINPAGYQAYKNRPLGQADTKPIEGADGSFEGEDGERYVVIGGQRVQVKERELWLARLEDQMSGRASFEGPGPNPAG